eukprot:SAG22_NODE_528_length_9431_cov_7.192135_2_plen_88_part_00
MIAGFGDTVGEKVEVNFVGSTYPTTVGADLNWEVQMNCCEKLVDQVLTVKGESNTLNYTNVACGQVRTRFSVLSSRGGSTLTPLSDG